MVSSVDSDEEDRVVVSSVDSDEDDCVVVSSVDPEMALQSQGLKAIVLWSHQ